MYGPYWTGAGTIVGTERVDGLKPIVAAQSALNRWAYDESSTVEDLRVQVVARLREVARKGGESAASLRGFAARLTKAKRPETVCRLVKHLVDLETEGRVWLGN